MIVAVIAFAFCSLILGISIGQAMSLHHLRRDSETINVDIKNAANKANISAKSAVDNLPSEPLSYTSKKITITRNGTTKTYTSSEDKEFVDKVLKKLKSDFDILDSDFMDDFFEEDGSMKRHKRTKKSDQGKN